MSSIATIFGRQLAASCSRAAVRPAARLVSTTAVSRDAQRKPDSAGESVKRGAANTAAVGKGVGQMIKEAIKDVGDAAKGIVGDGAGEFKSTSTTAKQMVSDRISGKNKNEHASKPESGSKSS